jgi:threonine dehydrogenase-like Zn-dependent dehydrogenase
VLLGVTAREQALLPNDVADSVFAVESDDFRDTIMAATTGRGADVIVDATADTSGQVAAGAIAVAAKGATLVLGGVGIVPLNLGEIRRKYLTFRPVRSHSAASVHRALEILADPQPGLSAGTEYFTLADVDLALRSSARHRIVGSS